MRVETTTRTLYKFSELSEAAQAKAIEAEQEYQGQDFNNEFVYDDAERIGKILGIEFDQRERRCEVKDIYDPAIYYSGFWSQGGGACFEGTYRYAKGSAAKIREEAPQDAELHRIADELQAIQRLNFYRLTATMKHRGRYDHSRCMTVDVDGAMAYEVVAGQNTEDVVTKLMRDFADWIYADLMNEYEYRTSEEYCRNWLLECDDDEYTESGKRA